MSEIQTQIFSVVMPADVAKRARVVAAALGKSRSSLVRDLLIDYLNSRSNEVLETSQSVSFMAGSHPTIMEPQP